jgi:ABC-type multidrug transport system ATPase subunit
MSANAIVVIDGLRKSFGALPVLQHVDLAIDRGRVTAILGPNGAGKTTLIKILLGLTRADAGSVSLEGETLDDDPRIRATIGYMPQIARYPENLSGAELMSMLADLRGTRATVDRELVDRFQLGCVTSLAERGRRSMPFSPFSSRRRCSSSTSPPPASIHCRAASSRTRSVRSASVERR